MDKTSNFHPAGEKPTECGFDGESPATGGSRMTLILQDDYEGSLCDFYSKDSYEVFLNRQQIGKALGYANPIKAIEKIHAAHRDRLDRFCVRVKEKTVESRGNQGFHDTPKSRGCHKSRENQRSHESAQSGTISEKQKLKLQSEVVYYSIRGVMEICRYSQMPKANDFIDWVWDIVDAYRLGHFVTIEKAEQLILDERQKMLALIDEKFQLMDTKATQLQQSLTELSEQHNKTRHLIGTMYDEYDTRMGNIEFGSTVPNIRHSEWFQSRSKEVKEMADMAGVQPREMYSRIIDRMCKDYSIDFKECMNVYKSRYPGREVWRLAVIEEFGLQEDFDSAEVHVGRDIGYCQDPEDELPCPFEIPGNPADWL